MAQVQLDNYSGHEETSQDSLTEVDEFRPPDPSLILSMETRATDPSLNISSPRAPECLSPAQDQTRATDPSLDISSPRAPEEEDDEEENSIPQHEFDVKKTQGKSSFRRFPVMVSSLTIQTRTLFIRSSNPGTVLCSSPPVQGRYSQSLCR